jgi:Ca2+-binding EF-hand superfamily protein
MLSMEEITALIKSRQGHLSLVEQLVKTLDANGDGFISIDEMMALAID